MTINVERSSKYKDMNTSPPKKASLLMNKLRSSIWSYGIICWIFGITDRSFTSFSDGYLSRIELTQLLTVCLLFVAWICLKPEYSDEMSAEDISTLKYYKLDSNTPQHEAYFRKIEARMLQLEKYHMISQEYVLPIPYLCQIYHLLNLKHLESIHGFSLNNLKIVDVSKFEKTTVGGAIKFTTLMESPLNVLRVLRQPVVEVDLILHTPYSVELSIPLYNEKRIIVIFNVLPLSNNEHKLFIDIYSNLTFPKPVLQLFLHIASCLTVFEDLPYLHKLAEKNIHRSAKLGKGDRQTMQLFQRFVDLYGSSFEQSQFAGAVELQPIYAVVEAT